MTDGSQQQLLSNRKRWSPLKRDASRLRSYGIIKLLLFGEVLYTPDTEYQCHCTKLSSLSTIIYVRGHDIYNLENQVTLKLGFFMFPLSSFLWHVYPDSVTKTVVIQFFFSHKLGVVENSIWLRSHCLWARSILLTPLSFIFL